MTTPTPPSADTPPPRRSQFLTDLGTTPNILTLSRIAVVLVAAGLLFSGHGVLGIILAVLAGVTDYLDGYLARRFNQVTRLGEILDQFSDIFYESLVLYVALAQFHFLPLGVMVAYLARELWVTSIRRFLAAYNVNIASSFAGKLKTNVLMWSFLPTFLSILGLAPALEPALGLFARTATLAGIALGYVSALSYTRQFVAAYDKLAAARQSTPPVAR